MRPIPVLLAALVVVACGSTAQVLTSPSPAPSVAPTIVPTAVPTLPPPVATPTALASKTPVPLSTPTPIAISTPTPISSGATPVPTNGATSSPGGSAFGPFAKLASFPGSDAYEVDDVAVTPGGFVAVGFGPSNGGDYYGIHQGIVWTSVDGMNWIESVDPSLLDVTPVAVVSRGTDLFLAGTLSACAQLDDSCTDVPQAGSGIWKSSNGGPWQLQPQSQDMQQGLIDNMILAGNNLVVYGGAGTDEVTTVWISQDGATWTSSTDLAGMDPVTSMTIGSAGFSAFGTIYDDAAQNVVLVAATSTDGQHFTTASAPQVDGTSIEDVAAGPSGMVGVGSVSADLFNNTGWALHSSDGVTWTLATNNDGTFAGADLQFVQALVGGGFVAEGNVMTSDNSGLEEGDAWFSSDGSDWVHIGRFDGTFDDMKTAALGPSGVVVFAAQQVDLNNDQSGSVITAWFAPVGSIHN